MVLGAFPTAYRQKTGGSYRPMTDSSIHMVTGAFGYSGKYITRHLLESEEQVKTLTNSPNRHHPFGKKVEVCPYHFDDPDKLAKQLEEVSVFYITYWVRFNHKGFNHSEAVRNTLTMFQAAKKAGVGRIIYTSITNPSEDSSLEYFSGKAHLERSLKELGVPYSILRPAVIFGREDILINNIAWMLRRFPVFGVFGDGRYRLQPIYVDDFARLAIREGQETENRVIDAIGPESFTYRQLVKSIGKIIGCRRPIISIPPEMGYQFSRIMGLLLGDVILTREEIKGLMDDLLYTESAPAGPTKLTDWVRSNRNTLGKHYASELARRRDRKKSYRSL